MAARTALPGHLPRGWRNFAHPQLRLTPRVMASFVLFAAALLGGLGTLAYADGRAALEEATFAGLTSTASEKEAALNAWVAEARTDIALIAGLEELREDVTALAARSGMQADADARDRVRGHLRQWAGVERNFTQLLVIEPEHGIVTVATDPMEEGTFREDRPYFIAGQQRPYVQNPYYSLQLQGIAMTASAPIRAADGRLLGVLAGRMNLEELGAIVGRRTGLTRTDDEFLVNTSNLFVTQPRLVADSAVLQRGVHTSTVKRCLAGQSGVDAALDYRGVPVYAAYRWIAERQLCLVVKVDATEALAPIQAFGRTLLLAGVVVLLAAIGLAWRLARSITGPVLALEAEVARFGRGERDLRLPTERSDELGALARQFNTMAMILGGQEARLQTYAAGLEQHIMERTKALHASEAELRALFGAMSDLILVFDIYGRCLKVASTTAPATYRPDPALLGQELHEIFPSLSTLALLGPIRRALETGQPVAAEYRLALEVGDVWLSVVVSPLTEETVLWVARDISERKAAEQALREADRWAIRAYKQLLERVAQLAQAVGTARDLHSVYDTLRQFAAASAPCSGVFVSHYDPERQERTAVYAWSDGEVEDVANLPPLPMTDSPHSRAVASGAVVVTDDLEAALRAVPHVNIGMERDAQVPRSSLAAPMSVLGRVIGGLEIQSGEPAAYTQEHTVAIQMAANLAAIATENVQLLERERQLRQLAEAAQARLATYATELERSNRELQDFAAIASHDLQEPLRKIQAFGDRLQRKESAALSADGKLYVDRMADAARRLQALINDLLAYSRITTRARPFEPVDLAGVAREVVGDLEVRIEQSGGRVTIGELPTIEADPVQMRQLFQNLIGNALKFCIPGQSPLVSVTGLLHGDEADGGRYQIQVADHGIGFDEAYLDRIFVPFQRLHGRGEYEGTGMGLAICRKIAERHGGSITATSAPGQGATFIVTLPIKQRSSADKGEIVSG